jgi:hypothetical protein
MPHFKLTPNVATFQDALAHVLEDVRGQYSDPSTGGDCSSDHDTLSLRRLRRKPNNRAPVSFSIGRIFEILLIITFISKL